MSGFVSYHPLCRLFCILIFEKEGSLCALSPYLQGWKRQALSDGLQKHPSCSSEATANAAYRGRLLVCVPFASWLFPKFSSESRMAKGALPCCTNLRRLFAVTFLPDFTSRGITCPRFVWTMKSTSPEPTLSVGIQ